MGEQFQNECKFTNYMITFITFLNYVVHKNHAWFDNNALEKATVRPKEPWRSGLKSFGPIAPAGEVTGRDRCSLV